MLSFNNTVFDLGFLYTNIMCGQEVKITDDTQEHKLEILGISETKKTDEGITDITKNYDVTFRSNERKKE